MLITAQPCQILADLTRALDRMRPAGRCAPEDDRAHPLRVVERQHLRDAPAHGRAVDRGSIHAEVVEDVRGIIGEARRREFAELTPAAARSAIVEGDRAEVRFEVPAQIVPPLVRVRLTLQKEQRGRVLRPADLDLEGEAVACADPVHLHRLHPCPPARALRVTAYA